MKTHCLPEIDKVFSMVFLPTGNIWGIFFSIYYPPDIDSGPNAWKENFLKKKNIRKLSTHTGIIMYKYKYIELKHNNISAFSPTLLLVFLLLTRGRNSGLFLRCLFGYIQCLLSFFAYNSTLCLLCYLLFLWSIR